MEYSFSIATEAGALPTKADIEQLFSTKPLTIELMGDHDDYEENITFDHLNIKFLGGKELNLSGYCGMWELLHPEKLLPVVYDELVRDLKDWIMDEMEYPDEVELWQPEE